MFKARYYKADGKKGRARELPAAIFDGIVNNGAMHQVVKAYLSNQRQGTASAKTRSDVRGGSRKPWRQKGTGRARQGTIRAVQWAGGGVAFPPIPHSWRKRVPKKVRSLARRSALNDRAEHDRVVLVELPTMEVPKTRDLRDFLSVLGLEGKTLILTDGINTNIHRSSRNLQGIEVLPFGTESVYDVLWANTVVIELGALDQVTSAKASAEKATEEALVEKPAKALEVEAESSDEEEAVAEPASDEGEGE
ncbi:MAG: 50S ribosomal protein L4 [Gemmatimonadetes bacterium]|jgi:50S ribosomal protein L4, bacterial/organelle|nr:50S ribosomal protein L4 [Gemmatimonadota bacterium]